MRFFFESSVGGRRLPLLLLLLLLALGLGVVRAQTETGTPRWRFYAGKNSILYSSPAIGPDHTVYVGVEFDTSPLTGMVLAIAPDGAEKWNAPLPQEVEAPPVLSADGTTLYVGCGDGRLYALDTQTGATRWTYDTGRSSAIYSSPAIASDGTIYIGSTYLTTLSDSVFYAVSPSGQKRWAISAAGSVEGAPAVAADGTIYFGAGQTIYAVSPGGTVKWTYPTKGTIWVAPAIGGDGTIYIGSDANEFLALTPGGKLKWSAAISAGSGAAVGADGTVYVGAIDGKLYALNPADGTPVGTGAWPVVTGAGIFSVPAVRSDGTIIFGSDDAAVRAVNADGSQRWIANVGDAVHASPVVDTDGTIYVGTVGGYLYSFTGSGAGLSGYSSWPMLSHGPAHRSRATPIANGGRLINVSTRGEVGAGRDMIAGVVVQGSTGKPLLVRGVGPALQAFGVAGVLPDPKLSVTVKASDVPLTNDNWDDADGPAIAALAAKVGAFPLAPGSRDAALQVTAAPNTTYSAIVSSADGGGGIALAEIYDADSTNTAARLINISTRGHVGTGDGGLIPGFVVSGAGTVRVLVRAVGPGLTAYGVSGVLARPMISVYDAAQRLVGTNSGWTSGGLAGDIAGAAKLAGAFALDPGSTDAAMILTLNPGAYTAVVRGSDGGTGEALCEVYVLPY